MAPTEDKSKKETAEGSNILDLEIGHYGVKVFTPTVQVDGRQITGLSKKELLELQQRVDNIYEEDQKLSNFNECEIVRSVMQGPIVERDEKTGEAIKNQMGHATATRFSIEDQRMRNRILWAIEKATKDKELKPGKSITIKFYPTSDNDNRCKYEDLLHIAEHMILFATDQTSIASYIADLHDKYVDLQSAAEAAIKKKK